MLSIGFYGGEYNGDMSQQQVLLCDIDGSEVPDNRPPFESLEEALKILDLSAERYSTLRSSDGFTVLNGPKRGLAVKPLARVDVCALNGIASASVLRTDVPRFDTEEVRYTLDDGVVGIARIILRALVGNKE